MKVFEYLINSIFWIWAFIVPTALFSIAGFLLYKKSSDNLPYSIVLIAIGAALGIAFAESIRKKTGLVEFFSRIIATPDLDNLEKEKEKLKTNTENTGKKIP